MESAFAWLGDIINWLGKFVPRLLIMKATHGGIAFRGGKTIKKLSPGLIFYWPLITEISTYPTVRQTSNLPTQVLMSADGKSVAVGGIVIYKVNDIVKALGSVWDLDDVIRDMSLLAISKIIFNKTVTEVCQDHEVINKELTEELRKKLLEFGVEVIAFCMSDFSTCMVLKTFGSEGSKILPSEVLVDE